MTLLNAANKIYLGGQTVHAIYAGANKVWPTATFTPASIPNLVHWLDAGSLSLSDNDVVTVWPNLASGAQPTIVGTPQPKFRTNKLNGKPIVSFNAGEGRLRSAWSGADVHTYTLIYVVRWRGPSTGRAFSVQYPPSNFLVGSHDTGKDLMYDNGTWINGPNPTWGDWGSGPGPWRMYGADGKATFGSRFFIDGTLIGTAGGSGGITGGWGLSGYDAAGAQETIPIDVAELLLYDRQLDVAERQAIEDYLRVKYDLPTPVTLGTSIFPPPGTYDPMEMPDVT